MLDALVRKSLLVADQSAGRTRFSMLETIRQFAEDQLVGNERLVEHDVPVERATLQGGETGTNGGGQFRSGAAEEKLRLGRQRRRPLRQIRRERRPPRGARRASRMM